MRAESAAACWMTQTGRDGEVSGTAAGNLAPSTIAATIVLLLIYFANGNVLASYASDQQHVHERGHGHWPHLKFDWSPPLSFTNSKCIIGY